MARKRHSDEDVLKLLRGIELKVTAGDDVASACRSGFRRKVQFGQERSCLGCSSRRKTGIDPEGATFAQLAFSDHVRSLDPVQSCRG